MLAAIVYATGFPIDDFMLAVAQALQGDGLRLGGAVQQNAGTEPCPAMILVDLATGKRFGISQRLGPQARGCRLDARGLAVMAALLDATVKHDVDLLVLNKFGKAEAEGTGLRSVFARAVEAGIPTLTAVRTPYTEAWFSFHGGLGAELAPRPDPVLAWCRNVVRQSGTAGRSVVAPPVA